ncbi:MAG: hypothetical protein ACRD2A_19990, partial [Vicinamibacterales bacterium]
AWTDTNNNKVVDCDLLNPALQTAVDTCAQLTGEQLNFGKTGSTLTQVNPKLLGGWGVRENDYQWGINVQQQIVERVSLDVGYNRRWFTGARVTDNLTRDPSEWDSWTINAPADPRLPGGGGYPITMYTVKVANAGEAAQNFVTSETDFGDRKDYWHGVDVTLNARLRNGLMVQVGTSTGHRVEDACETLTKVDTPDRRTSGPPIFGVGTNCSDIDPWETTLRGLASYTIPKIDVLLSGTLRSQPPAQLMTANWNVPNTVVQQRLGRLPVGAVLGGNTTVALLDNEHRVYADQRRTQIDLRIAKVIRFGSTRADIGVDLANLLNTNYATTFEGVYQFDNANVAGDENGGTWANPTAIYTPRFVRWNLTVDF